MAHISKQLRKKRSSSETPNSAKTVTSEHVTEAVTITEPVVEENIDIVESLPSTEPEIVDLIQEQNVTVPSPLEDNSVKDEPNEISEDKIGSKYDEEGGIEKWDEQPTINPFLELGLPPHITSWKLFPSPYDEDHNIMVHYIDNKPVSHMLLSLATAQDYVENLNEEMLLEPAELADSWFIKTPDNPKLPPNLHLTSNGVITNTVPLTEELMKELMPKMVKIYNPAKPKAHKQSFFDWAAEHKIKATLLGIIVLGPFLYGTYTYFL